MAVSENELVGLLKVCLDHTGLPLPGPIGPLFLLHSRGDRSFSLVDEGVTAYYTIVGHLLAERQISDRYSKEAVEQKLDVVLMDLGDLGEPPLAEAALRASVDQLLASFEEDLPERQYFLGIANLRMEDRLELGPVTIHPLTQEKYQALVQHTDSIIDPNPHYTDSEKATQKHDVKAFFKRWTGHALAEITSSADERRGVELSRRFLEEALHVLRFLGGFAYAEKDAAWIGEVGEIHGGTRQVLVLGEGVFARHLSRTGPMSPFQLDSKLRTELESVGLLELQEILEKDVPQRTDLQKALLNAVVWISRAQSDDSTEGRFVKLCIGMESILLEKGKYPKGKTMANRLASLLSKSPGDRKRIFKRGKDIYDIRNDIVHEGFSARAEGYLPIARHYALQSTSTALTQYQAQKWTTVVDVADWLDR